MKKIFTILFLFGITLAATAQHGYATDHTAKKQFTQPERTTSRNAFEQNGNYDNRAMGYSYHGNNQQIQADNGHRGADRYNQHSNQRADDYGYNRSMDARDRDRKIYEQNSNRQQQTHITGKVIVAGAVAGILAAALFSH